MARRKAGKPTTARARRVKPHNEETCTSALSKFTADRIINSGASHVKRLRLRLSGYESPADLWEACTKYFSYALESPIFSCEAVKYQGEATLQRIPHARAMSVRAMCFYIGLAPEKWDEYRKCGDEAFRRVCEDAETVIYTQKYEGAYVGIFNPTVAVRDLGLVDKKDVTHNVGETLKDIFDDIDGKNTGLPSGES